MHDLTVLPDIAAGSPAMLRRRALFAALVVVAALLSAPAAQARSGWHSSSYCTACTRDSHGHIARSPEAREQFMREWLEVVAQLRAHPSVIMWIPINEDWGEPPPDFQGELVRATRDADATRLVIDASGWKQLDDTDLVDVHDYGSELTHHRGKRDDIPLWIGELGGLSLGTGDFVYRHVDDLSDAYRKVIEQIPGDVAGFCWTQLTDVEQEQNGLLTDDRRPKVNPEAIREVNEEFLRRA
jgi:hypothetical protein